MNSLKKNLNFKETRCPDSFIYEFIGKIQNEWHPESCYSIVRKKKQKLENIKSSTQIYNSSLIWFEFIIISMIIRILGVVLILVRLHTMV